MKQTLNEIPLKVKSSTLWYPYFVVSAILTQLIVNFNQILVLPSLLSWKIFMECIGLIDDTHINAAIPT